jgi:hypothetical protein
MELEVNRSKTATVSEIKKNGETTRRYLQILPATSGETFLFPEGNWDFPETDFEKMIKIRVKYKLIQRKSKKSKFSLWGGRIRST